MMPKFARLALVTAVAASLPLAGAAARGDHGGQGGHGDRASHAGPADHGTGRGKAGSGRAAARGAPAKAGPAKAKVSAVAATAAFAGPKHALAKAVADSEAHGPKTVTRTITKAFTVVTEQFRAAVAIAEAVARSFFGEPSGPQPGNPLAGVPKPKALAGQAIASATGDPVAHQAVAFATGEAVARGPRTLTRTLTDSYTKVGAASVTAVATSVSVALSAGNRPGAAAGKAGLGQAVRAADQGKGAEPTGGPKTATDSGPDGTATGGGDACPTCQTDDSAEPPALY